MKKFARFFISSFSSSAIDLILFHLFCNMFRGSFGAGYAAVSTVLARIISSVYNYVLNYRLVFQSREDHLKTSLRYVLVAAVKMLLSAASVTFLLRIFTGTEEIFLKMPVDTVLFFLNYVVQLKFVYRRPRAD
jgi:putative flippase GtrA